ncbi:MAG: hypothetical protein CMO81_07695 [Waddliaceae bacterium]|nr:hypothetical protein [Waddliaceae bacterium]
MDSLSQQEGLFCSRCSEHLDLINPDERCQVCFQEWEGKNVCLDCQKKPGVFQSIAAAMEYQFPATMIIHKMKYQGFPEIAQGAGAFLALQFYRLSWPIPDYIVPVPIPFSRKLFRGYNQSFLLAETLGTYLQRPVVHALKRYGGELPQAAMGRKSRLNLNHEAFALTNKTYIKDATVLLVDDVLTTGSTLNSCGTLLRRLYPKALYAMTLCIADKKN